MNNKVNLRDRETIFHQGLRAFPKRISGNFMEWPWNGASRKRESFRRYVGPLYRYRFPILPPMHSAYAWARQVICGAGDTDGIVQYNAHCFTEFWDYLWKPRQLHKYTLPHCQLRHVMKHTAVMAQDCSSNAQIMESTRWELMGEGKETFLNLILASIATVCRSRYVILHGCTNGYLIIGSKCFILFLAVEDCLVGSFVILFSAFYDSSDY